MIESRQVSMLNSRILSNVGPHKDDRFTQETKQKSMKISENP